MLSMYSIFAYKGRKPSTNPVCVGIVHDPNKNYVMIMLMRRRQTIKQMTMKLHANMNMNLILFDIDDAHN